MTTDERVLAFTPASEIDDAATLWLWEQRIALGELALLASDHPTWITNRVYDHMRDEAKSAGGGTGANMWELRRWIDMNQLPIYRSSYWWTVS
jgi:hypothetical protein